MALTERTLRGWNLVVAFIQIVSGFVIFFITDRGENKAPVFTDYIDDYGSNYFPIPNRIARIPVGVYSAVFLWLSGIDHVLVASPGFNGVYNQCLCMNCNPFRWLEYGVSAGVMRVMIAQLSGVTELHLLIAIFGLTAVTMSFGWMMESVNGAVLPGYDNRQQFQLGWPDRERYGNAPPAPSKARVDWTPFVLGFVPHLFSWGIIASYFFEGVVTGDPPGFVWAIIFVLFFIDLLFAINQLLQFAQVPLLRGFGRAELGYIILSLTAKQLLAWINYGGAATLDDRDD